LFVICDAYFQLTNNSSTQEGSLLVEKGRESIMLLVNSATQSPQLINNVNNITCFVSRLWSAGM